jgi:tetratricopeptide (TPR) repeat protein
MRICHIQFYFLITITIIACTPKVTEIKPPPAPTEVAENTPVGPCAGFGDLTAHDRETAETAFVLYKSHLKEKKYDEALMYWKQAYTLAPASNGRVKYHFEDGATIYKYFFQNTQDTLLKRKYIDTIMMIYDKKKECFGDEAYINGLKAFDYYYNYPGYVDDDKIFQLFKSNFDAKGINADYFVVNPFTKLLYDRVVDQKISIQEGRKYADLIFKTVENGLATCKGKICEAWQQVNEYAPARLEGLEGVDGFFDCEYYAKKYYPMFKASPDSCEIINLVYARMLRGECLTSDPRLVEIKNAKTSKCYVAPPALSCAAQGNEDYSQGKYSKAIDSYMKCVEQTNDSEQKAKFLMLISKIYFRDLRNFTKSRKYALDAAKLKSGWGEPYMLIGNLYASSGPLCGTGRGWESQIVAWPAIDMWTKAKSIDPKVAGEASALISRYWQFLPKKEDIFFRNIKAGSSFFVPCWIQENTTVRTSD